MFSLACANKQWCRKLNMTRSLPSKSLLEEQSVGDCGGERGQWEHTGGAPTPDGLPPGQNCVQSKREWVDPSNDPEFLTTKCINFTAYTLNLLFWLLRPFLMSVPYSRKWESLSSAKLSVSEVLPEITGLFLFFQFVSLLVILLNHLLWVLIPRPPHCKGVSFSLFHKSLIG